MSSSLPAGLCETCLNARRVLSAKGSVFWLCELAKTNPNFRKYPAIPVVRCSGHASGSTRG